MNKIVFKMAERLPLMIAAFESGALIAQRNPDGGCYYRDSEGRPCIIGAGFTNEEAAYIYDIGKNGDSVTELTEVVDFDERLSVLMGLQDAHDNTNIELLGEMLYALKAKYLPEPKHTVTVDVRPVIVCELELA